MSDLREKFLTYFDHKGHHITASTPLIPEGDTTVMFNIAGMVPFKPYFLGLKTGTNRAASCQKCFRTVDIDIVGTTIRHMTFFEMLGNFSFGDYFKQDAIHFAWDFLTHVIGLDPKRLYVTIFKDDDEAEKLWEKEGIPNEIYRLGEDTNYWAMGETGPCGPCSEIYYDLGPEMGRGPGDVVGGDGDRYIEIWNLVFMQFNRQEDGSLKTLPNQNIDTGMGLERLAMLVEGKASPFQTSLFDPIRQAASEHLGVPAPVFTGLVPKEQAETETAYRIISDHIRAAVMLTAEGIIPSNVERGYVLRRLIRRASRYGRLLGAKEPFLHTLVKPAIAIFNDTYPELGASRPQVEATLMAEEKRFLETLEKGERELQDILKSNDKRLSGEQAFKLYDSFGFPLELTREICQAKGITLDEKSFHTAQEKAVETARAGWKGSGETSKDKYQRYAAEGYASEFVGYTKTEQETKISAIIGGQATLAPGDEGEILLVRTPFYPEGGGQVGDAGELLDDVTEKIVAKVVDTQKPLPGLIIHRIIAHKEIRPGTRVLARVDLARRRTTAYHHTATHLLNEALQRILGDTIRQAGSFVAPDRLRFDFTYPEPLDRDEIWKIEEIANEAILADYTVAAQERAAEDAKTLNARTLLGENYGEKPRFLLIGARGWDDPQDRFSLELCGGTHVKRTGEIKQFKVIKQSSVAAGIRRIEAVAGPALDERERQEENLKREALKTALKDYIVITSKIQSVSGLPYRDVLRDLPDPETAPAAEIDKALALMEKLDKKHRRQLTDLKREKLMQQAQIGLMLLEVGGIKLSVQKFDSAELQTLRTISDQVKRELGTGVVFLGAANDHKLSFVVSVTQDLVGKGVDASKIAKAVAEAQKGKGGGRKDFAQGGGPDVDWEMLINTVKETLS
ncbi:MAG: alanine--tRNA ligase [Elusimicrobiota bacterium]